MDADWDLHAVVRGCCSAASSSYATTTTTSTAPSQSLDSYTHQNSTFSPDLYQPRTDNSIEQFLNNLYHPLQFQNIQKPPCSPQSVPVSPLSVLGGLQDLTYHHQQQQQQQQQQYERQFVGKQQSLGISRCTTTHAQSTTKFKKRKNQSKRVCQVPAEGSPPDLWSWRKYGQKPIKGSPYPRGYYKCSTSKGCSARKQVERNKSDPGMLIFTYTGEHSHPVPTHRNSSAPSSRNKPVTFGDDVTGNKPPSPVSPAKQTFEDIETDDETSFDVVIHGDILDELEDLVGPATGDIFSDNHAPSNTSPWLSNHVATVTTAAADGD